MNVVKLGKSGITSPQNAFGALPGQRDDFETAIKILQRAYEGGMTFFDTARAYSDSEEKVGIAFEGLRDRIYLASKTDSKSAEVLREHLAKTLRNLKTDYLDLYQLHCVPQCYRPGDGTGLYEALLEAKKEGKVRHIGITTHKIDVAEEIIESGLYETLQFPFSYLSNERDIELVKKCEEAGMGFIAMKGLSGGLLTNSKACMAFMSQYPVLPIWGIQRMEELREWLSFFDEDVTMDEEMKAVIEKDRAELSGEFCRGCGYCAPCSVGIMIHQCARISQMIRRAPSGPWLSERWQGEVSKVLNCTECGECMKRCPYGLNIPTLLRKNYEDYQNILSGKTEI